MSTSRCGEIFITPPKCLCKERRRNYYSCCSAVAAAGAMSWRLCDYFSSLIEENKHNPRYLFNTVTKLTKSKASTGVGISQEHSSNDFMNYFTSKIDTIRDNIVTMQPSATVSHQILCTIDPLRNNSTHSLL